MIRKIAALVVFLVIAGLPDVLAAGPPGPPTGPPPCWPPPCTVPLDGGISILIAAGVAYGGKKLYDNRNNNKKNPS